MENLLNYVEECFNDFETIELATEILKKGKNRLDKDLDNAEIKAEYEELTTIINKLEKILENYK